MRRKKSYRKKKHGYHKRMSGFGGSSIMNPAEMIIGALIGKVVVNKALASVNIDDKIKSGIPLVLGYGLKMMIKNPHVHNLSDGMIVIGGVNLLQSFVPGLQGITEADITGIEENIMVGEASIEEDIMVGSYGDGMDGAEDFN